MPEGIKIGKLIADGGYYSIAGTEALNEKGITPVIPPPSHAVVQGLDNTKWHDKISNILKTKEAFMHITKSIVTQESFG